MHEAVIELLNRHPVRLEQWESLWAELAAGRLERAQVAALLASLATRLPAPEATSALVVSLTGGGQDQGSVWSGTVNVVGTGGGPPTFNISTAAALVAAAMGVPVVKTGSRAYTSRVGSVDMLERLGIRQTRSLAETADVLGRHGVAFAGSFVYPPQLARLARTLAPESLRPFGGFLNAVGPFLARIPVAAQVTGVSAGMPLEALRRLATDATERRVWLCTNDHGADELLGFARNVVFGNRPGDGLTLREGTLMPAHGGLSDLRPVAPADSTDHFMDVISGKGNTAAACTVSLNAAALAMAAGHLPSWRYAVTAASEALADGAARSLVERMRARRVSTDPSAAVTHA